MSECVIVFVCVCNKVIGVKRWRKPTIKFIKLYSIGYNNSGFQMFRSWEQPAHHEFNIQVAEYSADMRSLIAASFQSDPT